MSARRNRVLVLILSRRAGLPWWWNDIERERLACDIDQETVVVDRRPASPLSAGFLAMFWQCVSALVRARREGYRYILTFECDWTTLIVASAQTLLWQRTPRHVILQFIMREKTATVRSRIKYAFMRWCFSSVHLCVCSSRREADYYREAFGWPAGKVAYVPFHTDPRLVERATVPEERMVIAAGRTFRDYATLLASFKCSTVPLTIVASPSAIGETPVPPNVTIVYDIPLAELNDLLSRSMILVLPLEQREISIGQTVLLQAMTLGKAVIATRVNGTVDYIEHMKTGVLVAPYDAAALHDAVELLAGDDALRRRLGEAAREQVMRHHMPHHYAQGVGALLAMPR
jgi:glycosyltransferase involved in cell wall biosynthesis